MDGSLKQVYSFILLSAHIEVDSSLVSERICTVKGDLTHTVSPNLMLILSTYRVVLHPSYLQKVFSFIIFIKERYRFTILSEKNRAPGGVPCGRS